MKIAIIAITSSLKHKFTQEEVINYVKFNIENKGEEASLVSYYTNIDLAFKCMESNEFDIIFYIGENTTIYNHNIKTSLSKLLSQQLKKDEDCENIIKKLCVKNSTTFNMEDEFSYLFPERSIPLIDEDFYENGYIVKNKETIIVFLPNSIKFVKKICNETLEQLIKPQEQNNLVLKIYGLTEAEIKEKLLTEIANNNDKITIFSRQLDTSITINSDNTTQNLIAEVCSKLSRYLYSTDNTTLEQTVSNLLQLHNKKIVLAETITNGILTNKLFSNCKNFIDTAYIFGNFESIQNKFYIDNKVIEKFGKYSVNTVYELNHLLLQNSNAEISIFVLGDESSEFTYIAIGDIEGIHVYKNKVTNINNNYIETIVDTTLFYLIKKLNQNHLQFR